MITKKIVSVLSVAIVATSFLMLATVSHAFGQGCYTSISTFLTIPSAFGQSCTPPPANMVSWWPGDNNANDIIDGNPGTLQGNAAFAPGKVNQAFSFDGTGDSVDVVDNANLDFGASDPMTIDAWVYINSGNSPQHILGKRVGCGGGATINYQLAYVVGTLEFHSEGSGIKTAGSLPLNSWTHIAVTYDGSSLLTLYVNGVVVGSFPSYSLGAENNDPLKIGRSGTCTEDFSGLIDEVEIFNRALSTSEIKAIFDADSAGKCKAPIEHPTVIGGEIIPIESTSLLLAGIQSTTWMIPVVVSAVGIGLFVVSRKSENS